VLHPCGEGGAPSSLPFRLWLRVTNPVMWWLHLGRDWVCKALPHGTILGAAWTLE
jgi:hypothetical protein